MAHADYIAAAKQANRQPAVFMQVEQADVNVEYYTSQSQWQGSDTLTEVRTAQGVYDVFGDAGDVWHKQTEIAPPSGAIGNHYQYLATNDFFINHLDAQGFQFPTIPTSTVVPCRVEIKDHLTTPTVTYYSNSTNLTVDGSSNVRGEFSVNFANEILNGETWYFLLQAFHGGSWIDANLGTNLWEIGSVQADAQVITSEIDMGLILTSDPIFSVDDVTEAGATLIYSYTYSDDNITYSSGGAVIDGGTLTASRYYKIQADFTTSTGGRGKIREIQISEGLFRFFGSHIDEPFSGIQPLIVPDSVSTLNQKIQIGKGLSTTGETSVKLFWVDETADMIAAGYLKGKDVQIFSGFVGLSTAAYEPILVGTWYDHSLDEVGRVITVKIRDAMKQFEKRTYPEEVIDNTDGSIDTNYGAAAYTTTSLVTVMKDLFDQIGLRDRYIHPDFDTLEAGDYAATKYKVSREFTKPIDVFKLLDELGTTGSMYLVPLGDGRIKPKPFDINAEHTAELDAREITFTKLEGNIKEFFSRFYAYYNPKTTLTSEPTKADDYDNGTAILDGNAELRWFPEKGVKQHFDQWKVGRTSASTPLTTPPQALIDLMTLWNALFTEPLYTVTAKDIPPRYANIEPADVIQVDNLHLPIVQDDWDNSLTYIIGDRVLRNDRMYRSRVDANTGNDPSTEAAFWQDTQIIQSSDGRGGITDGKHFFVLGRKFNPNRAIIELDLMEMPPGTLGGFSSGFSSGFDV